MTLLFVEDDTLFAQTLIDFLEEEGHTVLWAPNATRAFELSCRPHDLLILDLYLHEERGDRLLAELRASGNDRPALFLTSATDPNQAIACLEAGADDYIRKPCDLFELNARLKGLMRRYYKSVDQLIELWPGYTFNPATGDLYIDGKIQIMNAKERQLLSLLVRERGRTVSYEAISEALWGIEREPSFGALRVYINTLKKIIGSERIINVRGEGYIII
ncbi:MAG: response regulator transcription factor [Campylobacterales bacterium]